MAYFQRLVVDSNEPESRAIESALAHLDERSPSVRRVRHERDTTHFWIDVADTAQDTKLFVKRYRPPLHQSLSTIALRSRAEREYENSRLAVSLGLPALGAIAFAERRTCAVVVDQLVAFRDAGDCCSATALLRQRKDDDTRREILRSLACGLRRLHESGYSHLQMSPRNFLKLQEGEPRYVFIDHNAAILLKASIHATPDAMPDLLNLFDSAPLFPDAASRAAFLEDYAPGRSDLTETVEAAIATGRCSKRARRLQKVRSVLLKRVARAG